MLCFLLCKKQRCCAKMHLMQKCIFAYILRSKMFSITFCFAEHFPLENVRKNAFDALQKCIFASNAFLQRIKCIFAPTKCYKCIWCQNAFDAKMHLMPKCILAYIFQRKMFSNAVQKCIWCVHFVTQNVTNAFLQRITFYEVKCSASHFPKENVQLCKNAFDAYIL